MVTKEQYKRRLHILSCLSMAADECVGSGEYMTRDLLITRAWEFGKRARLTTVEIEQVLAQDLQTLLIESIE